MISLGYCPLHFTAKGTSELKNNYLTLKMRLSNYRRHLRGFGASLRTQDIVGVELNPGCRRQGVFTTIIDILKPLSYPMSIKYQLE